MNHIEDVFKFRIQSNVQLLEELLGRAEKENQVTGDIESKDIATLISSKVQQESLLQSIATLEDKLAESEVQWLNFLCNTTTTSKAFVLSHEKMRDITVKSVKSKAKLQDSLAATQIQIELNKVQSQAKNEIVTANLPTFDGVSEPFAAFWKVFLTKVDTTKECDSKKMTALVQCCKGDALNAIIMLPVEGQFYPEARVRLVKQFGHPKFAELAIIKKLHNFKPAKTLKKMCNSVNEIETILAKMKENGGGEYNACDFRISILPKFQKEIAQEVMNQETALCRQKDNKELKVSKLIEILRETVVNAILVEEEMTILKNMRKKRLQCIGCNKNHKLSQCTTVVTLEERWQLIEKQQICRKCFADDHSTDECREQNCHLCDKDHNRLLCKLYKRKETESSQI